MKVEPYTGLLAQPMEPIFYSEFGDILKPFEGKPLPLSIKGHHKTVTRKPGPAKILTKDEAVRQRDAERLRRLEMLVEHFGIKARSPKDKWYALAAILAELYVPGLGVSDPQVKAGAEKVWNTGLLSLLYFEMSREMADGTVAIKKAASNLAKRSPWKTLFLDKGGDRAEAIKTRFSRIRGQADVLLGAEMFALVYKHHAASGDTTSWQRYVEGATRPAPPLPYV